MLSDYESSVDISDSDEEDNNLIDSQQAFVVADDSPNFYEAMRGPDAKLRETAISQVSVQILAERDVFLEPMNPSPDKKGIRHQNGTQNQGSGV